MTHQEMLDNVMRDIAHEAIGIVLETHVDALQKLGAAVGKHLTDADLAALNDYLRSMERFARTLGASGL